MLYWLLLPLSDSWAVFNVFSYITFRTAGAALTALLLALLFGPSFISTLRRLSVGQKILDVGPDRHQVKEGTPTMGGILILFAWLTATLLWVNPANRYAWILVAITVAFGLIGFIDDYLKVSNKRNLGLTARAKFILQALVAACAAWCVLALPGADAQVTTLSFPFLKNLSVDLGLFYIPFFVLVVVGCSNAVNLTDGLDGLAIGGTLIAAGTYAVFTYIAGHKIVATYLQVPYVAGLGETAVFCGALVGASLGFLWFNAHPAEVFMGDVGSLSLGAAIGSVAILAKQELLLVIVGGLFVLEALSVIAQVASFKLTGKRVLRMAPLHHHFELMGWAESKIIVRFWILALICALLGLATLKLR